MSWVQKISLILKKVIGSIKYKFNIGNVDVNVLQDTFTKNRVKYNPDYEKIRIAFIFQIASFWPNWESFYYACKNDNQTEVRLYLLTDEIKEHIQISGAREFLEKNYIEYEVYHDKNFDSFNPHIIVLQTPYDYEHRYIKHQTTYYMSRGHRVIYIPYGIEIADTEKARRDHFFNPVVQNCWRVFTFSDLIKYDYEKIGKLHNKVVALGHPKFDYMYHKNDNNYYHGISKKIANKRIVVWHLHFIKSVIVNNKRVLCTPNISEYFKFIENIEMYSNLFFIVLPHPKFIESLDGQKFIALCKKKKNVFIDLSEDYRHALCSADYMMTDRSSLMIEVAVRKIPVLYLDNADWHEPMTNAIKPILDSYYHGTSYIEMKEFVDMCLNNIDPKYNARCRAIEQCLSKCDGKSGFKIKEYIKDMLRKGM